MLASEKDQLKREVGELAKAHKHHRSGLLPVLQHIQREFRHISPEAIQEDADAFQIHPVEVHGVVSFYSFLTSERKGRFIIRLCQTISCEMMGKRTLARQLQTELGIKFGETTKDGMFTLEYANCLGMCDQGPAMLVNDEIYTRVTPESAVEIIDSHVKRFGANVTHHQGAEK